MLIFCKANIPSSPHNRIAFSRLWPTAAWWKSRLITLRECVCVRSRERKKERKKSIWLHLPGAKLWMVKANNNRMPLLCYTHYVCSSVFFFNFIFGIIRALHIVIACMSMYSIGRQSSSSSSPYFCQYIFITHILRWWKWPLYLLLSLSLSLTRAASLAILARPIMSCVCACGRFGLFLAKWSRIAFVIQSESERERKRTADYL